VLFYLGGGGPQAKQFSQKVCFSLANLDTSMRLVAAFQFGSNFVIGSYFLMLCHP